MGRALTDWTSSDAACRVEGFTYAADRRTKQGTSLVLYLVHVEVLFTLVFIKAPED